MNLYGDADVTLVKTTKVSSVSSTERSSMETDARYLSPLHPDPDDQLVSTKAEMGEVREENEKLKVTLTQIMSDYRSLQMRYRSITQSEVPNNCEEEKEDPELVSLSLGRFSSDHPKRVQKKADTTTTTTTNNNNSMKGEEGGKFDQGLELGLDCRFYQSLNGVEKITPISTLNSLGESKEEQVTETWPPNKSLKIGRSEEEDIIQHNPLKKARVSIRAVCNSATMNDGCQWRKYGQKLAKGNPCPRAYYRCTVSPSCPVRKHVQRCAEEMSVLITTYEGTHNHPLPVSATAMASTTSAAASMLQSPSSTSHHTTSTTANLHGLNFTRPNTSHLIPHHPFYFPNTTISTNQSHPTVTLDLTTPINRSNIFSPPRYSSTCLDFSSSSSSTHMGSLYQPFNMLNKSSNQNAYLTVPSQSQQQSMTDTIAAATKEITSNPSFKSALAAAITSFVGNT